MHLTAEKEFEAFAAQCRQLLADQLPPDSITWSDPYAAATTDDMFGAASSELPANPRSTAPPARVPTEFAALARNVFHHSSPGRYHLIYTALWRITRGERHLLENITDDLTHALTSMEKQVTRDAHKMKAFVRFRKIRRNDRDWYVAWHQPDHHVLRIVAPFFKDRFASMNWTILTPAESLSWNQHQLTWGSGAPHDPIGGDALEELWQTYYASTFNPARANPSVMKTHMPVRYWQSMPETRLIPDLLKASSERTSAMLITSTASALDYLPEERTIPNLRQAVQACQGCPLYHDTTHAVCSEGPLTARMAVVGEQPGDQEDLAGRPFIGPSGEVLNRALSETGIPREILYITESVKHFKHERAGARRLHRSPDSTDIAACRPWLMAELEVLRPAVVVCLGATAAQSILGQKVALKDVRGRVLSSPACSQIIVTSHPAHILRIPEPQSAAAAFEQLKSDLQTAWHLATQAA